MSDDATHGLVERDPLDRQREIGRGLRSVREDLGVNMGQLADALRCAVGHVSDRELGRVAWSPEMLREHLAALAVSGLPSSDTRTDDEALDAIRRGSVGPSTCARCHEPRTRWCEGCGYCATTCCACDAPLAPEAPHG